jgi:hypothetical protein
VAALHFVEKLHTIKQQQKSSHCGKWRRQAHPVSEEWLFASVDSGRCFSIEAVYAQQNRHARIHAGSFFVDYDCLSGILV